MSDEKSALVLPFPSAPSRSHTTGTRHLVQSFVYRMAQYEEAIRQEYREEQGADPDKVLTAAVTARSSPQYTYGSDVDAKPSKRQPKRGRNDTSIAAEASFG